MTKIGRQRYTYAPKLISLLLYYIMYCILGSDKSDPATDYDGIYSLLNQVATDNIHFSIR